jgi:SWI/SNF-related matrix-associated actin-dependent regulator 1 of chromatin subfamily A
MSAAFPYQDVGAEWLTSRRRAYLADEQGLGKTVQAIMAADRANARKVSIICPASVRANWEAEIERWSAGLWDYDVRSYDIAVRRGIPEADTYIIDEAHYLKSAGAQRSKRIIGRASHLRDAPRVWALSGTPAPNHVGELYTWLSFMGADQGLTYRQFLDRYTHWKMTDFGPKVWGNKKDQLPGLWGALSDKLLRRTKSQVLKDLPPIRWGDITLACSVGKSAKEFDNALLIGDDLPTEDEALARLRREIGEVKAPALADFIADEMDGSEGKLVVFAWHKSVLDVLESRLARFGAVRIDGSTPGAVRGDLVKRFQTDPSCRVFLGNIIAAGTGITLTAASNLIFAEMSWVPGENDQAAMRVHRIGQSQPVLIRTASLRGSLDEAVNAVLARKTRALSQFYEMEAA